jgi:hypothetical protein
LELFQLALVSALDGSGALLRGTFRGFRQKVVTFAHFSPSHKTTPVLKPVTRKFARRELMYESIFTEYDNGGGQSGLREHPGFSAYNKLFTTFSRGIKQLTDMMPSGSTAGDALIDYLNETRFGG